MALGRVISGVDELVAGAAAGHALSRGPSGYLSVPDRFNLMAYVPAGFVSGTTDVTSAVTSWLAACAGTHGYVPAGTYVVDPSFTFKIKGGTTIEMAPGAVFKLKNSAQLTADNYVFGVNLADGNADNVTLVNFTFDGNRANQTKRLRALLGYKAANLKLIRPHISDCTGAAMVISNCPKALLDAILVERCGRTGADATCEQGVYVGNDVAVTDANYARGGEVRGGRITGSGLDGLIIAAPHLRVWGLMTDANGIDKTTIGAAGLYGSGTYFKSVEITGVHAWNNSGNGIDIGNSLATTANLSLHHNFCWENGEAGIQLDRAVGWAVEDNTCWNNYKDGAAGVTLSARTSQKSGIVVASAYTAQDGVLRRNRCYDDQATKTQVYGIQFGAATGEAPADLVVEDNDLRGNLTAAFGAVGGSVPLNLVTSGFGRFARNRGHSPTVSASGDLASGSLIPATAETITLSPGSALTINGITAQRHGDEVVLIAATANATLTHGAAFLLKGATNVTPPAGGVLRFVSDSAIGGWRETARSF